MNRISESTYYRRKKKRRTQEIEDLTAGGAENLILTENGPSGSQLHTINLADNCGPFHQGAAKVTLSDHLKNSSGGSGDEFYYEDSSEAQDIPSEEIETQSDGSLGEGDGNGSLGEGEGGEKEEESLSNDRASDDSSGCTSNQSSDGMNANRRDTETFNLNDSNLDTPVNLLNETCARDILLLSLGLSVRFNWSYENIISHLQCQNALLELPCLPQSKTALWTAISRETSQVIQHAYCESCLTYLGLRETLKTSFRCPNSSCSRIIYKAKVKYFLSVDLKAQLQNFFSLPDIAEHLKYRNVREKKLGLNSKQDIFDGEEYLRLVNEGVFNPDTDFTFVFNVDGVKVLKGSKCSAHPLFIRINELPPNLRQKYVFLAGVWVDEVDPNMNAFLRPFVDQVNDLSSNGVEWKPDGTNTLCSKLFPLCECVDSKCRYTLFNMTQYNGSFGCTVCDIKGVYSARNMRYPILPPNDVPQPQLRTEETLIQDMLEAERSGRPVKGVKGVSALMNLKHHKLVNGCGMDDLHTLYEGNGKHHTDLLLSMKHSTSVTSRLRIINERMKQIRRPSQISRDPGDIIKRSSWKGSQWRNWVLFYGCLCMEDLIPQKYIDHFAMLSHLCFLMSQDEISSDDIDVIERLAVKYVQLFQKYFGVDHMFYNVHLLLHFANSIRNLGPLWSYSTFNFESWNRKSISQHVHSAQGAALQIVYRHLIQIFVNCCMSSNSISKATKHQLETLLSKKRQKSYSVGDTHFLGMCSKHHPSDEEKQVLEKEGYNDILEMLEFHKMIHKSVLYKSVSSEKSSIQTSDSVVYTWHDTFCSILSFVTFPHQGQEVCGVFVKEFFVEPLPIANHIVKKGTESSLLHFEKVQNIRCPSVVVCLGKSEYFIPLANCHEID